MGGGLFLAVFWVSLRHTSLLSYFDGALLQQQSRIQESTPERDVPIYHFAKFLLKLAQQKGIPVGYVPSAAVAVWGGGGVCPGGGSVRVVVFGQNS